MSWHDFGNNIIGNLFGLGIDPYSQAGQANGAQPNDMAYRAYMQQQYLARCNASAGSNLPEKLQIEDENAPIIIEGEIVK